MEMNVRDENTLVLVERRGGKKLSGPTNTLKLTLKDDTGTIHASVSRGDFARIGRMLLEKVVVGDTIIAAKGTLCPNRLIFCVKAARVLRGQEFLP